VGILGGIFDPVHNGHLALAACARRCFRLSKVIFIPAGRPPHKSQVAASAADRLAMVRLAVRNDPMMTVWDGEIRRKGVSYTADTLRALARAFPGSPFYFIVGSDTLHEIETWHCWRDVLAMVTLCVAHRPGYGDEVPSLLRACRIEAFSSPELDISSTMVREKVAQGRPFLHLVPEAVGEYIYRKKLYTA
jgi:nicotinate-nucleotide adenylyltransferase